MNFRPELLLAIILIVWSAVLTALFLRFYLYFTRISKKTDKSSLISKLDTVLALEQENKKGLEKVLAKYDTLVNDVSFHVQKIGLLRFNPFKDTGGDQSFILTLVDSHNSGVIISSYHTRSGTRWYAKSVKNGKGIEHELTAEETEALTQAKNV